MTTNILSINAQDIIGKVVHVTFKPDFDCRIQHVVGHVQINDDGHMIIHDGPHITSWTDITRRAGEIDKIEEADDKTKYEINRLSHGHSYSEIDRSMKPSKVMPIADHIDQLTATPKHTMRFVIGESRKNRYVTKTDKGWLVGEVIGSASDLRGECYLVSSYKHAMTYYNR